MPGFEGEIIGDTVLDDDKSPSHSHQYTTAQSKGPLPLIFNFLFNFIDLSFHTVGNVGLTFQRQIKIHFAQSAESSGEVELFEVQKERKQR